MTDLNLITQSVVSMLALALCGIVLSSLSLAQTKLPPEVQADLLKTQILQALEAKDFKGVLDAAKQYDELKLPMPPPLRFIEAKAASATGDATRAFATLERYLATTDRKGRQYAEALALHDKYHAAAAKVIDKIAATKAKWDAALPPIRDLLRMIASDMINIPGFEHSYRMSKYDVTFAQYDLFAAATGRARPGDVGWGRGNRPIINVSWDDAKSYVDWLDDQSGLHYRLPTEAEWEYAAHAGSTTKYPWGDTFSSDQANGKGTNGRDVYEHTAPVGQFPPNAWELYDMIGNVWQWTDSCYFEYSGANCSDRVQRGGSWDSEATDLRVSSRYSPGTTNRYDDLGFRLAQD